MVVNSKNTKNFTPLKAIDIKDVKDPENKELFKTYKDGDTEYMVLSDRITKGDKDVQVGDFVNALQKVMKDAKTPYSVDFESFNKFGIPEKDLVGMVVNSIYYGEKIPLEYKAEHPTKTVEHNLVIDDKAHKEDIAKAQVIADTSIFVRRLQDTPTCYMRPQNFADEITKRFAPLVKAKKVKLIIHDEKWLKDKGFNLLLGVNAGSADPACLIEVQYMAGNKEDGTTALVGKGVCFDSGGYNLKPGPHMRWMKYDMTGAATVMGTIYALAENNVKTNVVALGAMVANEIGPKAQHPDDVWKSYNGKYVEIDNTDAEGRLIMADTIAYAVKDLKKSLNVNRLIDISTLTGAMMYALGETYTGVWTSKDSSWDKYQEAANKAGELVWRMPFHKDFRDLLKSDIADIANSVSSPKAGSSRAAEFLRSFTDDIDYIHLDVAATSVKGNRGQASMLRSMYNFVSPQEASKIVKNMK